MSDEPSLLEFPCDFPLKVMGRDSAEFRATAQRIVADHATGTAAPEERPSRDGNFLSLTFTIRAESREQLDAIYSDLSAHEDVMVVL